MHSSVRFAAIALGIATLAAPAFAQTPPPPPWRPYPVLGADLGLGGTGSFSAVDNTDTGQLCYMIFAAGAQNVTGASIRDAQSHAPVVALQAPGAGGTSGACANVDKGLAKMLADNPGNYYVALDSAAYPNGVAASGALTSALGVAIG